MASRTVGLSGPAGSGKSEAALHLVETHGFTAVKFAGPLKAMLMGYYLAVGATSEEAFERIEGSLKEEPDPYLNGKTPRHAMETLGTEWGRVCMGADFWIRAWQVATSTTEGPVVTDDARFDNEAEAIKAAGGEVIRLKPKVQRRKKSKHVAEAGLSDHLVDHEIVNDGTVGDLRAKVSLAVYPDAPETFGPLE